MEDVSNAPPKKGKKKGGKFNDKMHIENTYFDKLPNFAELSEKHDFLKPFVTITEPGKGTIDFSNPQSCRALTRALLLEDFQLDVHLPLDRLCPTVTLRENYIRYLHDLIARLSPLPKQVRGLDIGVGASAIYPLLGAKIFGWNFVGADINAESLEHARVNVAKNGLSDKIVLRQQQDPQRIFKGIIQDGEQFDFSMCNPPFFTSSTDRVFRQDTAFDGVDCEMVCEGGEEAFVKRMVAESFELGPVVRWYTTMLGKKQTMKNITKILRESGRIQGVTSTTFNQGKTQRWCLAWQVKPLSDVSTSRIAATSDSEDSTSADRESDGEHQHHHHQHKRVRAHDDVTFMTTIPSSALTMMLPNVLGTLQLPVTVSEEQTTVSGTVDSAWFSAIVAALAADEEDTDDLLKFAVVVGAIDETLTTVDVQYKGGDYDKFVSFAEWIKHTFYRE